MSEFQSRLETEVIKCDNIKWKSVVLLYSALAAKEHIGKLCVAEVETHLASIFQLKHQKPSVALFKAVLLRPTALWNEHYF